MKTLRGAMAGAMAVALLAGACSGAKKEGAVPSPTTSPAGTPTSEGPASTTPPAGKGPRPTGPLALTSFASCTSLLKHFKEHALKIATPWGLGSFASQSAALSGGPATAAAEAQGAGAARTGGDASAASGGVADSAAPSHSATNIQEQGVDEPDVVKTDGRRLVTLFRSRLVVSDITGAAPRVLGSLALAGEEHASDVLLAGDRVVVLGQRQASVDHAAHGSRPTERTIGASAPQSFVKVVDVSTPASPTVVATLLMDGVYVSSRLVAGVVRLVVHAPAQGPTVTVPYRPTGPGGGDDPAALAAYKAAIARSRIDDWIPHYTLERAGQKPVTKPLAPCSAVLRPQDFSGLDTVSVLTVDPADPQPAHPACVLGGGRIVYASPASVYVATERWSEAMLRGDAAPGSTGMPVRTQLHQFAIPGGQPAEYVASGEVDGTVLNQFSMSEHAGHLRVATTIRKPDGATDNVVSVVKASDAKLVTVGRLAGLGHEQESIQSVRFIGDRGYVVTFRQTDPLYVLDLRDPARPKKTGELEVPGFSSYLHPLNDRLLLGVGTGPADGERGNGLQISLFDVGDPARPKRLANRVYPFTNSPAQRDHHAFLWWPETNSLVLPAAEWNPSGQTPWLGAFVVPVDLRGSFGPETRLTHSTRAPDREPDGSRSYASYLDYTSGIQRAVVSNGRLLTLSAAGVMTSDLRSLADQAWTAWPA